MATRNDAGDWAWQYCMKCFDHCSVYDVRCGCEGAKGDKDCLDVSKSTRRINGLQPVSKFCGVGIHDAIKSFMNSRHLVKAANMAATKFS